MNASMIAPFVLMGVFLAYTLYTMYKRKKGSAGASRAFFERTGYRYAEILNQPIEAHVAYGEQQMKNARNGYRLHMIRDFHGLPVHSVMEYKVAASKVSMSYAWSVPLPGAPRVVFQVAEKSLRGFTKGLKEAFSNSERVWKQQYPHVVQTGNPQLDERFHIYSDNPQGAYAALQTPGLIPLLLQCAEVDMTVYPDQIRFSDPSQKNVTSAMGGTFGMMAIASNPAKAMALTIPIHEHIAQLLATTYQACS